jgi:hypothetical protein
VSYAEGGSVVFDAISTDKVPEQSNLCYTDERVNTRIATKLQDKSISNISISGSIICNEILTESGARLKRHVVDMDSGSCLHAVGQLLPKSYKFINHPKQRYGVIAQELETVLPNLVNTTHEGSKSVNYLELIPFLIGSIRELKQTVEQLQHDVSLLHSQLI